MIGAFLLALGGLVLGQSGASLHGRVIDAQSARPLRDVRVVAAPATPSPPAAPREWTAATAADGSFVFDGLPPGMYSVSATTVGYIFVRRGVELRAGTT